MKFLLRDLCHNMQRRRYLCIQSKKKKVVLLPGKILTTPCLVALGKMGRTKTILRSPNLTPHRVLCNRLEERKVLLVEQHERGWLQKWLFFMTQSGHRKISNRQYHLNFSISPSSCSLPGNSNRFVCIYFNIQESVRFILFISFSAQLVENNFHTTMLSHVLFHHKSKF